MPNYVALDDKITRVMPDYTICETVDGVTREGFVTKSAPGLVSFRHSDEGITWVRGWRLPDDEDVKAARVAQSLDENKMEPAAPYPPPAPYPLRTLVGVVTPTTTAPAPIPFLGAKTTC